MSADALEAIVDVAALGSGVIELTSRANVQIRGLDPAAEDAIADRLWAAGMLPSAEHDRVRNILASPIAGRHPDSVAATDVIVTQLDRGLCADAALTALPGRFLFAVQDGSGTLGRHSADVALEAVPGALQTGFELWLGGIHTSLGARPQDAAELALAAARAFLELRRTAAAGAKKVWRIADIDGGAQRIAELLGGSLAPADATPPDPLALGAIAQCNGAAAVTVLPPLGRMDRETAQVVASLARACASDVRCSPRRTLTFVDVDPSAVASLTAELAAQGLIVSDASGWWGLSACAGQGACTLARVDVVAAATVRAVMRVAASPDEHWTACERGCGRPPGVDIHVSASASGLTICAAGETRPVADVAAALTELSAGGAP